MSEPDVVQIAAEGPEGSFGLWPCRLDCVTALVPGILSYRTSKDEVYVAVDQGILVKTGADVAVTVRRAVSGTDLATLRDRVEKEFRELDQEEKIARSASNRMESAFLSAASGLGHE